jgi:hypothetical protein
VRADLGAEAVLQGCDDPAAVGVVLRVGGRDHEHVQRQPQHVAADLDIALLHHVEHRHLDPFGQVRQFIDGDDAAVGARDQAVVDGFRVAQAPALGHAHRVHVADEVGDGGIRGGKFFHVPFGAVPPCHPQPVPFSEGTGPRLLGNGLVRVLVQFRVLDHRRPFVQQPGQRAQEPRLALPALTQQDNIVARDQGALKLGKDGAAEAEQSGPRIPAFGERGEQVVADFVTQVFLDMAGCTQFTDGEDFGSISHHSTVALPLPGIEEIPLIVPTQPRRPPYCCAAPPSLAGSGGAPCRYA